MENKALTGIKLNELIPSKFSLELIAEDIREKLLTGNYDVLQTAVILNAMENLSKLTKDKILDIVLDELDKHPKASAEILGAKMTRFDSIKYDYTHIEEWVKLEERIKSLKERQKEIEDGEKKWHRGDLPIKDSTTTYKITLNK
jgi:hypothetical protein